jgi:uncharacterized protein YbjT (DUF2867 family)
VKLLVTGATGLIGRAVCAHLQRTGHYVVGVRRIGGSEPPPPYVDQVLELDIARAREPGDWAPHLHGVEAVVNCAGVLQDSPRESTQGVHVTGIAALFDACEDAGIRRIVHFSAIGVDRGALTAFSRSKLAGDEGLMARDLDWIVLRPSVVVGRAAFGGSALFRGLAPLPWIPDIADAGPLQLVQLDDVVRTVAFFVDRDAPARVALEIAGPERLGFAQVIAAYRRWLGWRPAHSFRLPRWMQRATAALGDLAGALGWRPPLRTTARHEVVRGAVGDPSAWQRITGIEPQRLGDALQQEPASVQERWFAKLYLLKPVVFVVLSLFWIVTGLISLGPGWEIGVGLMEGAGAGPLAAPSVVAGALADIVVGSAIALRRTARAGLYGALGLSLFYLIAGTLLVPSLWAEPLGPMLKVFPIMVLTFVALALLDER